MTEPVERSPKRGQRSARPPTPKGNSGRLPDLTAFRRLSRVTGESASATVIRARREERY